ncbi:MAG: hypothetical protein KJ964_05290 [Verrucomicrobia bacterium]|nr:hypothetical protein [Verrucomicrobiota bacterium]MBU1735129.1 hypothetical protein [Verrucomicrobiota bacterium]MBU1855986.1 hypothetical protein [Verrucomicrobiota bacterium]
MAGQDGALGFAGFRKDSTCVARATSAEQVAPRLPASPRLCRTSAAGCFTAIVTLSLIGASVVHGQTNADHAVKVNSPDIFWLKRPLHVAADSVQYIFLPIPGGEGLDQVRNFKYIIDLPEGFELVGGSYLNGHSAFGDLHPVYPSSVKTMALDKNITRHELGIPGIGFTGLSVWLSHPYISVVSITGTGGRWIDFYGETRASDFTKVAWLLRWSDSRASIQPCRGVVDVDDIVIRRKSNGQIVFEEHFNDGSFGKFKGGQKNGVSLEKENDNYFVRIKTGDAEAKIQQSINASGTNAPGLQSLIPGEDYAVTCRARTVITRTPDYIYHMPVWIKIGGGEKETEIRAHYEYEIGGKQYSVPEQKLRVIVDNKDVKNPKTLETVLWSEAEDCMGLQLDQIQDRLLDLTKSCGIKLHLTELKLNPWKSPYDGKVNKMDLRDPLTEKIKRRGMNAMPYLAFPYKDMGFEAYVSNHPPAPGKLALDEYVNQFGQTNKATKIYNVCPTRLCDEHSDYWPVILKFLKEAAEVNKWDGLMWDFEVPNILTVPLKRKCESCFCPDCIEAFKQYTAIKDIAKAPENRVMLEKDYPLQDLAEPARSILSNYPLEWLKFKGDQKGKMWQSMITAVREVNPAARFYLYSGSYQAMGRAEAPWHHCEFYGVYPPAAGRYVDVFMEIHSPMRGKGKWGLEEIKLMREALKADSGGRKVPVLNTVFAETTRYLLAKNDAIQSVALTEANGFQIYSWGGMFDSQTWSLVREGIQVLTAFEDFFLEGTRFDQVATLDKPLEHSVWIKGEDRVVFIFNNTDKDEKVTLKNDFRVKYAANRVTATNHATGEIYADPETIACTAPAYDTTIIHFKAR